MKNYILLVSKLSVIWYCLFIPYSAQALVFSSITALYKVLIGEAHAWAISIKQSAVSANQIVRGANQSSKTLAQAINVIHQSESVIKAMINYNPSFGQPLSTQCNAMLETKLIINKQELSYKAHLLQMQNISSAISNNVVKITIDNIDNSVKTCSSSDKNSGKCSEINKHADVNYAASFANDNLTAEQVDTAYKYTKNIIHPKIDITSQCKQTSCRSSAAGELSYNAFLSMAANSLYGQINQRKVNHELKLYKEASN